MAGTVVGVDIDTRAIRAVEVRSSAKAGGGEIVRVGSVELPDGAVRGGEVVEPGTVSDALRGLWASTKFSTKRVALGFGGSKAFARDVLLPRVPLDRVRESLPFTVQEMIPLPVAEAILDFYPAGEEVLEEGPMLRGILVAAQKDAVRALVNSAMKAKLSPASVDLNAFGMLRATEPLGGSSDVVVVVGVTASTTNIVIAQGGVPRFVRMVAIGGDDITASIARRLQISAAQAEHAKQHYGIMTTTATAAERPVIEAIYGASWDLLTGIRDTLAYFASSPASPRVDRMSITGDGADFPGFDTVLADLVKLPVTRGGLTGAARMSKPAADGAAIDASLVAYGLALGSSR